MATLYASQVSHKTTLTCKKKKMYIYICPKKKKKKSYAKLTYYDYLNKNFEHPDLRITKIGVQQK